MIERKVIKALPSSFVKSSMKLATDRGAGEAKLWVGQMSNSIELDAFFEFDREYGYSFSRENLLDYLNQVKLEYVYQRFNNYKEASLLTWNSNYGEIQELQDSDFAIHLRKFTDTTRYYVRAEEAIFKEIFRKIAVPKLTNVVFIKDTDQKHITVTLELNLEYENATGDTGTSGLSFCTGLVSVYQRNRIVFGAPGTGKSFKVNKDRKALLGADNETDYERVTFHPDYSYANFVGTYKPVPCKDSDGKDAITYEYVPGPFMRVYVNALRNGRTENIKPYLLIIEEINRANVAAVFGDIFQLLDRDDNDVSEYPIQASEDIKKYLAKELGGDPEDYSKIKIPDNMFIWATMNSADQGVFPMDTAFKRRWDFTYIGIDDNDEDIRGKYVILGDGTSQKVEWNKLRKAINHFLAKQKINEDKQLGPYFISRKIVVPENGDEIDRDAFIETFKNKVLMYLFDDAAKQKRATLFEGCFDSKNRYSEICKEFEDKGLGIFFHEIAMETGAEDITINGATVTDTAEGAGE